MYKISIPQLYIELQAPAQANLMQFLLSNDIPVASSCKGDAVCGKCVLNIEFENPQKVNTLELNLIDKYKWKIHQRASCQIIITSHMTVKSTYW